MLVDAATRHEMMRRCQSHAAAYADKYAADSALDAYAMPCEARDMRRVLMPSLWRRYYAMLFSHEL